MNFQPEVWLIEFVSMEGSPQIRVANLWTEFAAHRSEALARMGKNCKTLDFPRWLQLSKGQILNELPVV
jgi:hypothetical protein